MTKKQRGRRPLPRAQRKEKLVQARVPGLLDEALRQEARRTRVSVSQLIRNVLEDTFHLVENAVTEAANLGQTVKRDARRLAASAQGQRRGRAAPAPPFASIEAWQEVLLNRDVPCELCKRLLTRGDRAFAGIETGGGPPRAWLCPPCAATL